MPLLSIIMPCWNAASTLDAAIGSIVAQTEPDWELLAIDDGSTDATPKRLREWRRREPRLRVITQRHRGIVPALQRGCAEAQGTFWARMDADDICMPTRFEQQLAALRNESKMALCGTQVQTIGDDVQSGRMRYERWLNSLTSHEAMTRERFIECPIAHPTFLAHRQCFERIGYAESDWPEDYDFVLRAHAARTRFVKVPEKLLQWRDHAQRACLNDRRYSPESFRMLKRRHLAPILKGKRRFWQWGAGDVGKVWLREWDAPRPECVVDINPKKFGKLIHRYEIVPPESLPAPGKAIVLVAVGAPGARKKIRAWFDEWGYVETRDFWFIA